MIVLKQVRPAVHPKGCCTDHGNKCCTDHNATPARKVCCKCGAGYKEIIVITVGEPKKDGGKK